MALENLINVIIIETHLEWSTVWWVCSRRIYMLFICYYRLVFSGTLLLALCLSKL